MQNAGDWLTQCLQMLNRRDSAITIRKLLLPLSVYYVVNLEFRPEFFAAMRTLSEAENHLEEFHIPVHALERPLRMCQSDDLSTYRWQPFASWRGIQWYIVNVSLRRRKTTTLGK